MTYSFKQSTISHHGLLLPIPYLVGLAGMIFISQSSDRTAERRYQVAIPVLVGGTALVLLGAAHSAFLTVVLLSFVRSVFTVPWAHFGRYPASS